MSGLYITFYVQCVYHGLNNTSLWQCQVFIYDNAYGLTLIYDKVICIYKVIGLIKEVFMCNTTM